MEFEPTEDMLAVMAEVDADPRSKFFGRQARMGAPPALDAALTGGEPFLTRAERKLVSAFREEYSHLCFREAVEQITSSPWGRAHIFRCPVNSFAGAGRERPRGRRRDSVFRRAPISARQCLIESQSLRYTDGAKTCLAIESLSRAEYLSSRLALESVLAESYSLVQKYFAALNLGLHSFVRRDFLSSAKHARLAQQLHPNHQWGWMLLLVSLTLLDEYEAAEAAGRKLVDFDQEDLALGIVQLNEMLKLQGREMFLVLSDNKVSCELSRSFAFSPDGYEARN